MLTALLGFFSWQMINLQRNTTTLIEQAIVDLHGLKTVSLSYTVEIDDRLSVDTTVPFQQTLDVPVNLQIERTFPVDMVVPFQDSITVPINETININQTMTIPLAIMGRTLDVPIPIQLDIPVNLTVDVPIDTQVPVQAEIPVSLPISQTFRVTIDRDIPIQTDVPLKMSVPIQISLADTAFSTYVDELILALENLIE
jgi:hypothetical protein